MSLALDGLLDQSQERTFYLHLSGCASCRAEWNIWQAIEQKFHTAPLVLPTSNFLARWEQNLALAEARHDLVRRRVVSALALLGTGLWLWAALSLFAFVAGGVWVATHPTLAAELMHTAHVLFSSLGYLLRGAYQVLATLLLGPAGALLLSSLLAAFLLILVWLKVVPGFVIEHSNQEGLEAQ